MYSEAAHILDLVAELDNAQALQLEQAAQEVNNLWDSFGSPHLSQKVVSLSGYLSLISQMETKALIKTGNTYVCDTIDVAFENSPLILPDPAVMEGRELSLFKSYANTYCGGYDRCIYVHYNASTSTSLRGGVVFGGSHDILQTTTTRAPGGGLSHTSIGGCTAYFPQATNGTQAIKEIACGEQIILTFRAVAIKSKFYWIAVNQSEAAAKFSQSEAGLLLRAQRRVDGDEDWTVKANGFVVPRTTASRSFSVTENMGWIEYLGSSSSSITFPTHLEEGFMCYVQNNSHGSLRIYGCSVATGQSSVPPRSVCLLRRGSGNFVLVFYIASLDRGNRG